MHATFRSILALALAAGVFALAGTQLGWFDSTGVRDHRPAPRQVVDLNAEGEPLVDAYPRLDYVTAQQVAALEDPLLIDTRPPNQFAVLRIAGSRNVPAPTGERIEELAAGRNGRPMVFFASDSASRSCFRAATVADRLGLAGVHVLADGVLGWASDLPERTELFGKRLDFAASYQAVISEVEFGERCLDPDAVLQRLDEGWQLVDLRPQTSRTRLPIAVPGMSVVSFAAVVERMTANRGYPPTVFIDDYGRSVRYLQYQLRHHGVSLYAFVGGGALRWYRDGYDRNGAHAAPMK